MENNNEKMNNYSIEKIFVGLKIKFISKGKLFSEKYFIMFIFLSAAISSYGLLELSLVI